MSFRIPYNGAGIAFIMPDNKDKNNFFIFMGCRSMPPFNHTWSIPGGSIEKKWSEDAITGARREFQEETGINPLSFMKKPLGEWNKRFPFFKWKTFFFLLENNENTIKSFANAVPCEFSELKWVSFNDLRSYKRRPYTIAEMSYGGTLLKESGK